MFYVSVVQYYFDKTRFWLKIASKGAYEVLTPRFLHVASDYYFCFLQVGTSVLDMIPVSAPGFSVVSFLVKDTTFICYLPYK